MFVFLSENFLNWNENWKWTVLLTILEKKLNQRCHLVPKQFFYHGSVKIHIIFWLLVRHKLVQIFRLRKQKRKFFNFKLINILRVIVWALLKVTFSRHCAAFLLSQCLQKSSLHKTTTTKFFTFKQHLCIRFRWQSKCRLSLNVLAQ